MQTIKLELFGSSNPDSGYIAWSPVPLTVSGTSPSGVKTVTLRSRGLNGSRTQVVFLEKIGDVPADTLTLTLDNTHTAKVYVAGKFQTHLPHNGASEDGKDVVIEAVWSNLPQTVEGSLDVMVRVRKNANLLSAKARNDFLNALAELNGIKTGSTATPGPGKGIYVTDFVNAHVAGAYNNEHGDSMFLPWHRLYILDLERLLQRVNPTVTLPYWKFDDPAPNIFSSDFMGATAAIPSTSPFTPGLANRLASFS